MSLARSLRQQIFDVAPFAGPNRRYLASAEGITVSCELTEAERLGGAFRQLQIADEAGPALKAEDLKLRAERLTRHVTHLLEPLKAIEIDGRFGRALLRSAAPRQSDQEVSYYELLAETNRQTTLRRFAFTRAVRRRQVVDFVLSPDQLEWLLDDLVAATR